VQIQLSLQFAQRMQHIPKRIRIVPSVTVRTIDSTVFTACLHQHDLRQAMSYKHKNNMTAQS